MRLVEYTAKRFLDKNRYNNGRKQCVENGFQLGTLEFFGQDFWLTNEQDYTDVDFVKAVYKRNLETGDMDEQELIENLARFLCGYEVQVNCREAVKNDAPERQRKYFQSKLFTANDDVSNMDITSKISDIKEILELD